jgi:hypothetical protein
MPLFRNVSDLHLEFYDKHDVAVAREILPRLDDDPVTTLLLVGDIGLADKPNTYVPWIADWADQFERIIYIAGNHEFYKDVFEKAVDHMKENLAHLPTVTVLEKGVVQVDDVNVIGATCWTSMRDSHPEVMGLARQNMNDYFVIRSTKLSYGRLQPYQTIEDHYVAVKFIEQALAERKGQKNLVMTHHAPCQLSIHEAYSADKMNDCYYTDLSHLLDIYEPAIWLHGHMHTNFDYNVFDTRVICNPRGYVGQFNPEYDPAFTFEL